MKRIALKDLEATVKNIGGTEATIEHIVNPNANSWLNYWWGVCVTLYCGSSSVSFEVRYDEQGYVNGYGEIPNPTGCAANTARQVVSMLEGFGYFVVAGPNCQ